MYYTIEGKRVLGILYIAGLITGTLFFNITIKMQVFKVSDFLDFTEYMKMLENIDLAIFCSYVVFVRFRQLLLFFVGLFFLMGSAPGSAVILALRCPRLGREPSEADRGRKGGARERAKLSPQGGSGAPRTLRRRNPPVRR